MLGPSLAPLCVLAASTARSALAIPLGSSLELNQVTLEVPSEIAEQRWLAPHEIQGNSWLSKYDKQRVDVEGVVTARSPYGFYIQSVEFDDDDATSEGLYIYGAQSASSVRPGDLVRLTGTISEYASLETGLHLTELVFPSALAVMSHGHELKPIVLGVDRVPPGERIYVQDQLELKPGIDIEADGEPLEVKVKGLAFWESLENMLVTIPSPRAVSRTNYMSDIWIVGEGYATHSNARGGLTTGVYDGQWDANPEALLMWKSLDGSRNEQVVMGTTFENITGIVTYLAGSPVLLPLTAPVVASRPEIAHPPGKLKGDGVCRVAGANYNVENLNPRSRTIPTLAEHVVHHLNLPDVIGLEEIQDNSGARNDGTTAADQTFKALTDAIAKISNVNYAWLDIAPNNNQDGGQPGGNIRPGILYRTDRLELDPLSRRGHNDEAQSFVRDVKTGETTFALNPGLIEPKHEAWTESRKPLAASFIVRGSKADRKRLHVIVAHFSSKRGSGVLFGRIQTAANGAVEARIAQATVVDDFVAGLLALDPDAHLLFLADANEFSKTQPLQRLEQHMVELLVEKPEERYSFSFDQNSQQIDHAMVSPSLLPLSQTEILHLSTHGSKSTGIASDHDPVLAVIQVC